MEFPKRKSLESKKEMSPEDKIKNAKNFDELYEAIRQIDGWLKPIIKDPETAGQVIRSIDRVREIVLLKSESDSFNGENIIDKTNYLNNEFGLRNKVRELLILEYFNAEEELQNASTLQQLRKAIKNRWAKRFFRRISFMFQYLSKNIRCGNQLFRQKTLYSLH